MDAKVKKMMKAEAELDKNQTIPSNFGTIPQDEEEYQDKSQKQLGVPPKKK